MWLIKCSSAGLEHYVYCRASHICWIIKSLLWSFWKVFLLKWIKNCAHGKIKLVWSSCFFICQREELFFCFTKYNFHFIVHMFRCKLSHQKYIVSFDKQQLQKRQNGYKGFSFFHCVALMWQPPTPWLTTQPPTSQLAKQICSCLSAQYESHTSSWLSRKKQTKVPSQPCQNVLL